MTGSLDAAAHFSYRLPELFSGFPLDHFGYPTTSSPQARVSASVLLLIRVLLGLEPDGSGDRLNVRPILPADALPCRLEGLRLCSRLLSLCVDSDGSVELTKVPEEGRTMHPAVVEEP